MPAAFKTEVSSISATSGPWLEVLQERVRQKMETAPDKQVFLRGDGTVQLQDLMTIIDRLKDAGVDRCRCSGGAPGER